MNSDFYIDFTGIESGGGGGGGGGGEWVAAPPLPILSG